MSKPSLLKSSLVVASMTFLSRILGFVRDVIFARIFAASPEMDAFLIAFKIPNFMRRLFAEGAFNQAFVPTIGETKATEDKEHVKDLIAHVSGTLGGYLLIITAIGMMLAPILVMIFAPGYAFNDENTSQYELTIELLRVTYPYIFFISLVAFAGGILNTYGEFALPAFTPVILNIVLISSALFLAPMMEEPIMALAIGVFIAGLCQLLLQIPFLAKKGLLVRPQWNRQHSGVRKILKLMLPALFGASISQISLLLDIMLASLLVSGSISWLYYSDRLMEFPLGILGVALATVILPALSKDHHSESKVAFSRTLDKALRWAVYLGIPSAIGLFLLSVPIIATLFGSEQFQRNDILMSSYGLMAYSFGLVGFILVKVLLPAYYSRQDTKTPVKIGIISLSVGMFFNLIIVLPWYFSGAVGAHAGLAIATSLSAIINALLLYRGLITSEIYIPQPGWRKVFVQIGVSTSLMIFTLLCLNTSINYWLNLDAWGQVYLLLGWIGIAAFIYLATLWLMGVKLSYFYRKG
ncbi:MAG: murein biosynthesis integral membrane protein MurJ [Gammaproteobacteria bacterium]|nr:murein biosynthesis integral membrane protein MurJ [Gammaproteobacteria bacterium]